MIPLQDLNPRRRFPIVTYGLIAINVLVFLWELSFSEGDLQRLFETLSVVPAQVSQAPFSIATLADMVRSMFFHGGWGHLLGNMLYLYLFGDNLEDRLGIPLYVLLYLLSGLAAGYTQVMIDPPSQIPLVGASGAISGVLGGYLVLFPNVEVRGIIPIGYYFHQVRWPAIAVLGLWFALQLFNAVFTLGDDGGEGGVAFFAHVGGFVAGAALVWLLMRLIPQPPAEDRREMLYERASRYPY
jgi:membrane associated rhomboid family serine protease